MMTHGFARRLAAVAVAAALSIGAAAAHDDPAVRGDSLSHETSERSLAAAEWLAARADPKAAPAPAEASPLEKVDWLLWRAGGTEADGEAAFAAELARLGYENANWSRSLWMEEMAALLAAYDATRGDARGVAEIEAELNSLPIVPLDEKDERELDRLLAELDRAAVPAHDRELAAELGPRIEAVLAAATEAAP